MNDDMLTRLIQYKDKLDSGQELTGEEKADLQEIGKYVAEMLAQFVKVLQEALAPAILTISETVKALWDNLPEALKEELTAEAKPPVSAARAQRQRSADVLGRDVRIEAVGRDLAADVSYYGQQRGMLQ